MRARLRRPGRPAPAWTLRLTLAAVASYVVAEAAFPGSAPLTASLTALLVVQLTPVSLLVSGLDRVVSVVAGVGVAVLLSSAFGLTWWTLGLLIGVSLVLGQVLRLGDNLLEVPISAMLVLGAGAAGANAAAGQRIAQTLVGAGIGVLSNLLVPPRVVVPSAAGAIEQLAEDLAHLLTEAGDDLASDQAEGEWLVERAAGWLGRARLVTHNMPNVGAALLRAEESRRLNVRALGTPDAGPGLRQGLEALEHSSVAVRSLFGNLDVVARREAQHGAALDPGLRQAFATVLHELADGLRAFGRLVHEEATPPEHGRAGSSPPGASPPGGAEAGGARAGGAEAGAGAAGGAGAGTAGPDAAEPVRHSLDDLHEARARLADLLLVVDPRRDASAAELVVALGQAVERLLRELDLDERARRLPSARRPRRPLPRVAARVVPVRRR